jgi:hypothetical protein
LASDPRVNKALLDTDTLSEIGKGIDPTVARHATSYRKAFTARSHSVPHAARRSHARHFVGW